MATTAETTQWQHDGNEDRAVSTFWRDRVTLSLGKVMSRSSTQLSLHMPSSFARKRMYNSSTSLTTSHTIATRGYCLIFRALPAPFRPRGIAVSPPRSLSVLPFTFHSSLVEIRIGVSPLHGACLFRGDAKSIFCPLGTSHFLQFLSRVHLSVVRRPKMSGGHIKKQSISCAVKGVGPRVPH